MHIPDHWHWTTIAEVQSSEKRSTITGPFGSSIGKKFFVEYGVPVIRGNNLSIGSAKFKDEGFVFISEDKAEELRGYKAFKNDLIFTAAGTIGQVGIIPDNAKYEYYIISNKQMRARFDNDRVDPMFAYYWFSSPWMVDYIKRHDTGSTIPLINLGVLRSLPMPLPPILEQIAIRQYLCSFDEKINNNNNINHTLEQIAQTLFKSWFVDFEPVKAKIAVLEAGGSQEDATLAAMMAISGKDADSLTVFEQEYPEKYAELRATAELFPSAMQDIESAKIPEGWNLVSLSNIASFASGKINMSELTKDTYISTENMLVNKVGVERATSLPSASTTPSFNPGHILISNIRPYFKKIWLARFLGGRSPDVLAFEHKKHITAEYLYNILYQDSFFDFMMQTSKGVKMPRGDKKAIMEWSCIEPDIRLVKVFSNKVKEFYSYIESHNRENTQLSQLRDTLLPKLLSGEITLPEAEELAKEADYV